MIYINMKSQGSVETIDQFTTRKEALEMLREYRLAYGSDCHLYVSSRCCRDWGQS